MSTRNLLVVGLLVGCTMPTSGARLQPPEKTGPRGLDESCVEHDPELREDVVGTLQATGNSYHEMVACSGLAFRMARSVEEIFITSLLDAQGLAVPGGFRWEGDGRYTSGSGGTSMTVRYFYGDDIEAGHADELVELDLFDLDNYLTGVDLALDGLHVEVGWTRTGPLVELFGLGADPPNPIRVALDDLAMPRAFGRLKMEVEVEVTDKRQESTVTYSMTSERRRLNPLLADQQLDFGALESQTISERGTILRSTTWGVGYNDAAGVLDGVIDFDLQADEANVVGSYVFAQSSTPDVEWTCGG